MGWKKQGMVKVLQDGVGALVPGCGVVRLVVER